MFITNSTSLSIDRLKILMKRHEMDRTAYAEYLDIPSNTLQAWENNTLKPSFIELVKFSSKRTYNPWLAYWRGYFFRISSF